MEKKFIHLNDFYRILIGEVPPEFYIELIIRTLVIYALITFGMKYLGKRTAAELSRSELAAISTLAATTGLVLLSPDRGLVCPIIVLSVILLIRKFVNRRNYKSQRFEVLVEGKRSTLVIDGEMQWQEMQKVRVSKEQLFAQVRDAGIIHLGLVKRLYMEASGSFSLLKETNPHPGLPAIPDWDKEFLAEQQTCQDWKVCENCGHHQQPRETTCPVCHSTCWVNPIMEKES